MTKRLSILVSLLVFAFGLAWGGQQKTPAGKSSASGAGGRMSGQGGGMKEKLGLTDQQAEQVHAVMHDFHERAQALKAKSGGQSPDPALQDEMKKSMEERDTRLKAILTPDQFSRLREFMSERREHHGEEESSSPSGGGMKERLGLTDQQAEKVHAVMQEFRERAQALKGKEGGQGASQASREEMRKLREERDTRIKAILTPEQFSKFQEFSEEGRHQQGGPDN